MSTIMKRETLILVGAFSIFSFAWCFSQDVNADFEAAIGAAKAKADERRDVVRLLDCEEPAGVFVAKQSGIIYSRPDT